MADRYKAGYMNYDEIDDRIEAGKLNAYDIVYTKDTHEAVFIREDKSYYAVKCRLEVYPSVVVAEYYLNLAEDTYVGQIVGIEKDEWIRLYNVNYTDDKFVVKQVGIDDYGQLTSKPQINGVTLEGNKTTAQLGIDIPTKFSQLYDDVGYVTFDHLIENYYSKSQTYSKTEIDTALEGKADISDIPIALADLNDDATHRTVTDTEKAQWNGIVSNVQSDWDKSDPNDPAYIKNKPTVPTQLAQLTEDTTHRVVTDAEKAQWNHLAEPDWNVNDSSLPGYIKNKPTKLSQFSNDESFITSTANNLVNYYLKSEVYTKGEVSVLINSIVVGEFIVVQELPQQGQPKNIYLVPKQTTTTNNIYDEYIWVNNAWECIGSTALDLSDYVKFEDLRTALADYLLTADFQTAMADYYDKDTVDNKLANKANAADLATVATSGDYDDLQNKPTIPSVSANPVSTTAQLTAIEIDGTNYSIAGSGSQIQSDWDQSDSSKVDYIKNKPTIPDAQIQSDWGQSDNSKKDFIKNKPTLGTASALDVASSGNAGSTEVVKGDDTRLSDARTPTTHTHTVNQITDFPTLGTASALDVATSGNADTTQVVKGDDTRLSDARTPTSHNHTTSDITDFPDMTDYIEKSNTSGLVKNDGTIDTTEYAPISSIPAAQIQSDWTQADNTKLDYIKNKPTLGTASVKNVPASGNASSSEVVMGNDTRLTDARNASDVYSWAKAENKPSYTKSEVGLGNVDNTSDATKKSNFTGSIASSNTGFVTGGDVYTELAKKVDKVEGKGLSTEDYSSAEKTKLSGISTGANKVESSTTNGNIKIDGTETQVYDGSGKADKVSGATNGDLAGLDANGNLTDSGVAKADIDTLEAKTSILTATAQGNPISFNTLSAQNAESAEVGIEPIQDLHGYSKPWVGGAGKNKLGLKVSDIKSLNTSGTWSGNVYTLWGGKITFNEDTEGYLTNIVFNDTFEYPVYPVLCETYSCSEQMLLSIENVDDTRFDLSFLNSANTAVAVTATATGATVNVGNYGRLRFKINQNASFSNYVIYPMIRLASISDATFEPYTNICPIFPGVYSKNLLPISFTEQTLDGIQWSKILDSDNNVLGVNANGQVTSGRPYSLFKVGEVTLPAGTYNINGCPDGSSSTTWRILYTIGSGDYVTVVTNRQFVLSETSLVNVYCQIISGAGQVTNKVFKPMIRDAFISDATFEPYDTHEIKILGCGKNLFDKNSVIVGKFIQADGSIGDSSTAVLTDYIPISNGQCVSSASRISVSSSSLRMGLYDEYKNFIRRELSSGSSQVQTISINDTSVKYIRANLFTNSEDIDTALLELGTSATAFEPFTSSNNVTLEVGQDVYGGKLDVETGTLTVTDGYIASYNGETLPSTWISSMDEYSIGTTPTTGAEVAYKLATPLTINLTPNEIALLQGSNYLSTNCQNLKLTYRTGQMATLGDVLNLENKLEDEILDSTILTDTVTGDKYKLVVTSGVLSIEQISD